MSTGRVHENVTGLILAGGQARRMGGVDKGLALFRGKRLVDHVYARLAPQVGGIIINANQNHDDYRTFGVRVVSDAIGNFAGPLAGLHAGLSVSRRPYLASVPCDAPFLPADLVQRLIEQLEASDAELAVAKTGKWLQPVFCLARRGVLDQLTDFLKGGGRKVDAWYASLPVVEVNFDDQVEAFSNLNTREDLAVFEQGETEVTKAAENTKLPAPAAAAAIDGFAATPQGTQARTDLRDALKRVVSCMDD